jgi:uncharacterized membrane protein
MKWLFAVIGFVACTVIEGISGSHSIFPLALLGGVLGFFIGLFVQQLASLSAKVDVLMGEVVALCEQIAEAKHETSAAAEMPAAESAMTPAPAAAAPRDAPPPDTDSQPERMPTPALMPASVMRADSAKTPQPLPDSAKTLERDVANFEHVFQAVHNWLFGGNTVVRVGIIVLFFGVAFLLKYAADNSMLPIELRLAAAALGATALLLIGWRVGKQRSVYGLVLQGGGVGLLYLTVFAATKLYDLLPIGAALPLMVAVCALSAFLAIKQNAPSLAFMGSAGGFLAPVLLSTGGGNHVALFAYYALLNAGIFAIAWFKAWRPLNLLGFVFTFVIGSLWGVTSYRPELFASTEPFLVLFFLMYAGIALLYAARRGLALKHYVDGTLVFGTPIIAIALQAALVKDMPFGLAWSAVALSAFYLAVTAWLARQRDRLPLLFESMLALAVIFATLAVPFAFSGPITSAAWAIEGAAIVWIGVRERRLAPFGFGLLMQLAAGLAFLGSLPWHTAGDMPVFNSLYIATLLLALAGLFTGWWLHGRPEARAWNAAMPQIGFVAACWGLLWWLGGGIHEIVEYAEQSIDVNADRFMLGAIILFMVATAWLAHAVRRKFAWPLAEWPALALAPVLTLLAFQVFDLGEAPLTGLGALSWPLAIASVYALLWRQQRDVGEGLLAPLHTLMFWTLCGLLALEGYWRLRVWVPEGAWSWSAWAYGFGLLLLLVSTAGTRLRWPVVRFARAYQVWGAMPLAGLLWAWSIASIASDGDASPLVWLPLLNPLDIAQLLIFLAAFAWLRRLTALHIEWRSRGLDYAAIATLFLWFNALLLRALHHWADIPYNFDDMMHSMLVQASVSVFWTICALAAMIWATRHRLRPLWFVGAALLALTIVKLFLFDLSYLRGIERIVSFISIGVLLLLIGYFSPLPPKAEADAEEKEEGKR